MITAAIATLLGLVWGFGMWLLLALGCGQPHALVPHLLAGLIASAVATPWTIEGYRATVGAESFRKLCETYVVAVGVYSLSGGFFLGARDALFAGGGSDALTALPLSMLFGVIAGLGLGVLFVPVLLGPCFASRLAVKWAFEEDALRGAGHS